MAVLYDATYTIKVSLINIQGPSTNEIDIHPELLKKIADSVSSLGEVATFNVSELGINNIRETGQTKETVERKVDDRHFPNVTTEVKVVPNNKFLEKD